MRALINKYYEITGNKKDNFKDVVQSAIESYNDNEHRTLKKTPNNAWSNSKLQITKHLNDMIHNENIYKSIPFNLVKMYEY